MNPPRSIPLFLVLLLQCLFVGGVFAALIALMTTTTRESTRSLVRDRLLAQLGTAHEAIDGSLSRYERTQKMLRERVLSSPSGYLCNEDTLDFEAVGGWLREGLSIIREDPFIVYIYQLHMSKRYFHDNGDPYVTECDACRYCIYTAFNSTARLATDLPEGPANPIATAIGGASRQEMQQLNNFTDQTYVVEYEDYSYAQFVSDAMEFNHVAWKAAAYTPISDAWRGTVTLLSCYVPLEVDPLTNRTTSVIGLDLNMSLFAGVVRAITPSVAGAHTSIYDLRQNVLLTSTNTEMKLFQSDTELWTAGQTQSAEVNAAYAVGYALGKDLRGGEGAVNDDANGNVVSVLRLRGTSNLDLLFVQSTPRAHYYASLERTEKTAIGISAGAAVLVLFACAGVLLAIRTPLKRMQAQMELAAVMRNDEVEASGRSVLTDVAALQAAFAAMNAKLLFARSFMPQSVLCSNSEGDSENNDNENEMREMDSEGDEGDLVRDQHSKGHDSNGRQSDESTATSDAGTPAGGGTGTRHRRPRATSVAAQNVNDTSSVASSSDRGRVIGRGLTDGLGLVARRVGVLAVNVRGFHAAVVDTVSSVPAAVADPAAMLVAAVQAAVARERGVVDSYHGDHFMVTFNAARQVPQAGARLCGCAAAVREALAGSMFARLSMGATAGRAVVGHLGTDTLRRFSVVGPVYSRAIRLEGSCAKLSDDRGPTGLPQCDALVDTSAAIDAENTFVLLAVGYDRDSPSKIVWAVAGRCAASATSDEWLYEVAAQSTSAAARYNAAFAATGPDADLAAPVAALVSPDEPNGHKATTLLEAAWARLAALAPTRIPDMSSAAEVLL